MRAGSLDGSKNRGQFFPFSGQDSKTIVSNNLEDRKIEGSRNDGTVPGRYVIQLRSAKGSHLDYKRENHV